ncbi:hypothetical protein ACGC1H_000994 [Rhizoctonia solani]
MLSAVVIVCIVFGRSGISEILGPRSCMTIIPLTCCTHFIIFHFHLPYILFFSPCTFLFWSFFHYRALDLEKPLFYSSNLQGSVIMGVCENFLFDVLGSVYVPVSTLVRLFILISVSEVRLTGLICQLYHRLNSQDEALVESF